MQPTLHPYSNGKYPKPDNRPSSKWVARQCSCVYCEHEWTAVYPLGCTLLECPLCGYMNEERLM